MKKLLALIPLALVALVLYSLHSPDVAKACETCNGGAMYTATVAYPYTVATKHAAFCQDAPLPENRYANPPSARVAATCAASPTCGYYTTEEVPNCPPSICAPQEVHHQGCWIGSGALARCGELLPDPTEWSPNRKKCEATDKFFLSSSSACSSSGDCDGNPNN